MNEIIQNEVRFFLNSVLWGVLLILIYDGLRIYRRVIPHLKLFVIFEDIGYWIISAVLLFYMMYQNNDGRIRGFSILGIFLGMIFYKWLLSDWFVDAISGSIKDIFRFFRRILYYLLWPLRLLFKVLGKIARFLLHKLRRVGFMILSLIKKIRKFLGKRLKKFTKTVKISITKD